MSITRLNPIRCIVQPDNEPAGSGTEDEPKENEPRSREYTQAEIDEIVAKRVAAKLDEIEAANKSELEKLTEQNQKLAAQLAEREHAALIQAACIKHGVVCPACAGMIPWFVGKDAATIRLPRMCGDDPLTSPQNTATPRFAPHVRG